MKKFFVQGKSNKSHVNSVEKRRIIFRFWKFLNEDTWQSWLVRLVLAFVLIKFVFFPIMSIVTGSPLPLVVVESCSMYHSTNFNSWWDQNGLWYEDRGITKQNFEDFSFNGGLNKGDIVLVYNRGKYKLGDIIIFKSDYLHPIIHRIIDENNLQTKGDHNSRQLSIEKKINENQVLGKAVARVPGLGWLKLIFFEGTKPPEERGFCKSN